MSNTNTLTHKHFILDNNVRQIPKARNSYKTEPYVLNLQFLHQEQAEYENGEQDNINSPSEKLEAQWHGNCYCKEERSSHKEDRNFIYYLSWDWVLGADKFGHKQSRESEYHCERKQMER